MIAKSNVTCVHCSVIVQAVYRGSWSVSNVIRHIKTHTVIKPTSVPHAFDENLLINGIKNI